MCALAKSVRCPARSIHASHRADCPNTARSKLIESWTVALRRRGSSNTTVLPTARSKRPASTIPFTAVVPRPPRCSGRTSGRSTTTRSGRNSTRIPWWRSTSLVFHRSASAESSAAVGREARTAVRDCTGTAGPGRRGTRVRWTRNATRSSSGRPRAELGSPARHVREEGPMATLKLRRPATAGRTSKVRKDWAVLKGDPHELTHAERIASGKALRDRCPRTSHANWKWPANRRDAVEMVLASERGRLPDLLPLRHGRMVRSAFTFYRGAALTMAADLASTPATGVRVQCCGDAHLCNFGGYATPERRVIFG